MFTVMRRSHGRIVLIRFQLMGRNYTTKADEQANKLLETIALVSITSHCNKYRSIKTRLSYSNKLR